MAGEKIGQSKTWLLEIGRSNKNIAGDEIVCSKIWPKMRFVGQYHMANLGRSKLGPV
jgi:hypothetical protein